MDYKLDLPQLRASLKRANAQPTVPDFIETAGERYIYDHIITRHTAGEPIHVGDIDLDAFDEDDIVSLIDDKSDAIDAHFSSVAHIVTTFAETPAKTAARRFF